MTTDLSVLADRLAGGIESTWATRRLFNTLTQPLEDAPPDARWVALKEGGFFSYNWPDPANTPDAGEPDVLGFHVACFEDEIADGSVAAAAATALDRAIVLRLRELVHPHEPLDSAGRLPIFGSLGDLEVNVEAVPGTPRSLHATGTIKVRLGKLVISESASV